MSELSKFVEVVRRLRDPEHGCPWDCAQTMLSLRRFLVEESGEYFDALEQGDVEGMRNELGDLLLQVVLNSQVAADEGKFTLEDVAAAESAKMIRRHPHVFGDAHFQDEASLRASWERVKSKERENQERHSAVDGVPRSMPALARAQKMCGRAIRAGFTWPSIKGAMGKVREEMEEVESAYQRGDDAALEEELGDLFFALVVLCRWKKLEAEEVLQKSIAKFDARFREMEAHIDLSASSLEEMLEAWKAAKVAVRASSEHVEKATSEE